MVTKSISKLLYALCLLAPWSLLWVDASLLFPYETGKAWIFRSIVELSFGLTIYQWLVNQRATSLGSNWFYKLMIAFLLWSLFTGLTGIDAYRSFWSNYERMAGLVSYLHWAMYLLCLLAISSPRRLHLLLVNIVLVVSIICILGLFEDEKRIISSLGNPIYLGNLAVLGIFLCGFLVAGMSASRERKIGLFIAIPAVVIMCFALINAASRGPFLAVIIGLISLGLIMLSSLFDGFKRSSKMIVLLGLILSSWLLISQLDSVQQVFRQSDSYALQRIGRISLQDQTTADRLMNWRVALSAAQVHPLLGWGQQNYAIAFTEHYQAGVMDKADIWFDRAHNAYLDILVASGAPGLILYILMLSLPILYSLNVHQWSHWQKGFAVAFFMAFMAKNLVGMDTFSSSLLWIIFIAILLRQYEMESEEGEQKADTPVFRLSMLVVILALTFFTIGKLNFAPYLENQRLASAIDKPQLLGQKEFDAWLDHSIAGARYGQNARLAVIDKMLVGVDETSLSELEAKNQQRLFQHAGVLISTELERQPRNYRIRYNGGLLLARLGHYDLAVKQFERLTRDAPERTVFWRALAQIYSASGDKDAAENARNKALQLNPKWKL